MLVDDAPPLRATLPDEHGKGRYDSRLALGVGQGGRPARLVVGFEPVVLHPGHKSRVYPVRPASARLIFGEPRPAYVVGCRRQ